MVLKLSVDFVFCTDDSTNIAKLRIQYEGSSKSSSTTEVVNNRGLLGALMDNEVLIRCHTGIVFCVTFTYNFSLHIYTTTSIKALDGIYSD